mmetsp:Transcript_172/g.486  ORF Transcript_172/g.486 Transcript_172/m.486 type:complete len:258 (+) Transcript_172:648-1421(+)
MLLKVSNPFARSQLVDYFPPHLFNFHPEVHDPVPSFDADRIGRPDVLLPGPSGPLEKVVRRKTLPLHQRPESSWRLHSQARPADPDVRHRLAHGVKLPPHCRHQRVRRDTIAKIRRAPPAPGDALHEVSARVGANAEGRHDGLVRPGTHQIDDVVRIADLPVCHDEHRPAIARHQWSSLENVPQRRQDFGTAHVPPQCTDVLHRLLVRPGVLGCARAEQRCVTIPEAHQVEQTGVRQLPHGGEHCLAQLPDFVTIVH